VGVYKVSYASERIQAEIEKFLEKVPRNYREQILNDIKKLGENPRPPQAFKLVGRAIFRLRSGDYRIFYDISEQKREVLIIGLRRRNERTYK